MKKFPEIIKELDENLESKAFDNYEISRSDNNDNITFWKTLNVDLEKKNVIYPNWAVGKYYVGVISQCKVTRNKERLYDIDYDDGVKLSNVREEHIRWLNSNNKKIDNRININNKNKNTDRIDDRLESKIENKYDNKNDSNRTDNKKINEKSNQNQNSIESKNLLINKLLEGVRVHARITIKGGNEKFVPGRIVKVHRGGTYDVECEGGRTEINMSTSDIMIGLSEGDYIEAKRPTKTYLQCTGVSWNATGSTLCVSYGKNDIVGWCDFPGAVCTWNVFGKNFDQNNPDYVLDHNSCLMCVKCHPCHPAIVAGGSFNGELLIWDLSISESSQLIAITPITEYGHKEPILNIEWLYEPLSSEWILGTVSTDGKILFWSLQNKLKHPIKGALLSSVRKGVLTTSKSKKKFTPNHGGVSISYSGPELGP